MQNRAWTASALVAAAVASVTLPVPAQTAAPATAAPATAAPAATPAATAPKPSARPATAAPVAHPGLAPADAYFGPFGMSPLSIRSTIGLLGRQYHYRTISDRDLLRKAILTEDALRIWRRQYPADSWLAPTFFHLEQLYQAVQTEEARKHATAILHDVVANYPRTKEGHLSASRLAAGFPPLVAESPLVSPAPSAAPAVDAAASPPAPSTGASASPVAPVSPAASAAPAAAAAPTAAPTAVPR